MALFAPRPTLVLFCTVFGVFVLVFAMSSTITNDRDLNELQQLQANWRSVPSRVVGSPDPPLPYRVKQTFPELSLTKPIIVTNEPMSKRLWFIDDDPKTNQSRLCRTTEEPATGEYEVIHNFGEAVAYSIAFHPAFDENGYFFIGSNDPISSEDKTKHTRVTRYTIDHTSSQQLVPNSQRIIIEWESNGHDGAAIAFGLDGMLYITSGDGTSDSDTDLRGQGLDHLLAKVLRIDADRPNGQKLYSVPEDNPFVDIKGARAETWAYGFRNPWRMSIDPKTGNLWVGNNGQDLWEQIYLVERGGNYGWSVYEGGHIFYANRRLGPTTVSKPLIDHPHSEARSITGGVVYYGDRYLDLHGAYIYGDYSTGKIWGVKLQDRNIIWHKELADSALAIVGFALDNNGELLIVDYRGKGKGGFYTLIPNESPDSSQNFPQRLSHTGLFSSVKDHQLAPGMIPYSVNAPLWSDGAYKKRYIYLPPVPDKGKIQQPTQISMTDRGGWSFPDKTVLVKSFGFEFKKGNIRARRWIETRLMTRQQGEWSGYSYAWNKEQTDAYLVSKEGLDRSFKLGSGEEHFQTWRYPSRSECMVCHSRAANFVLGLSTLQMNKQHDYGGVQANQLEFLHYLGVLQVAWSSEAKSTLAELFKKNASNHDKLHSHIIEVTADPVIKPTLPSELTVHWSEAFSHLVDPYDDRESVEVRARSYLHANCAQCHVQAGGGNSQIELAFTTTLEEMKLVEENPLHHNFDIGDARLVARGDPARSVLLHRVSTRGRGQMPQLATSIVDENAVKLLTDWIRQLQ